jgi:hypothetical protein
VTANDLDRCPSVMDGRASLSAPPRWLRCQLRPLHEGQCCYHRRGSQGGSMIRWWGANPRPAGFLGDLGFSDLLAEVHRLRGMLDAAGIDWKLGLTEARS